MAASQIALRDCSKMVREEPRYVGVCAEKKKKTPQKTKPPKNKKTQKTQNVVKHQKITANHTKHLKLMILVLFYVWEDTSLGLLKSFF